MANKFFGNHDLKQINSIDVASISLTGFTTGSVLFSGTSGVISQDNTNFFWDDTNNRLGLSTTTPAEKLHVVGDNRFDGKIYFGVDSPQDNTKSEFNRVNSGDIRYNVPTGQAHLFEVNGTDLLQISSGSITVGSSGGTKILVDQGASTITLESTQLTRINLADNQGTAFLTAEGSNNYINISTSNGTESINIGTSAINPTIALVGNLTTISSGASTLFSASTASIAIGNSAASINTNLADNASGAYKIVESASTYLQIDTVNSSEFIQLGVSGLTESRLLGGHKVSRTATAVSTTALRTDYYIGVTSTAAARTITLPAAATVGEGKMYIIKDESGGAATNNITIDPNGAETIDGAATFAINTNFGSATIICTGTAWFVI